MRRRLLLTCACALLTPAAGEAASIPPGSSGAKLPSLQQPIDAKELASIHAGAAPAGLTVQNLKAAVSDNSISAGVVQSGGVSFGANSFSNFSGIGNFIVNTGNNNILQGSLSVSVVSGAPGG